MCAQLGSTVYVYDSLMSSYDGGRPWRKSKLPSGQALYPTSTVLESGGPSRANPFTKPIESVNAAQSIHEVGTTTVDGQRVSEFTAVVPFPKLLIDNQPFMAPSPPSADRTISEAALRTLQRKRRRQMREVRPMSTWTRGSPLGMSLPHFVGSP